MGSSITCSMEEDVIHCLLWKEHAIWGNQELIIQNQACNSFLFTLKFLVHPISCLCIAVTSDNLPAEFELKSSCLQGVVVN